MCIKAQYAIRSTKFFEVAYGVVGGTHDATAAPASPYSRGNSERDQLLGVSVGAIQMPADIDQFVKLRFSNREARGNRTDAPGVFVEIPDELAAGAFFREAAAVLREYRNAWSRAS